PRTRIAGGVSVVTCKSDALRATICSSRSSIEYESGIYASNELSAAALPTFTALAGRLLPCCPMCLVHPFEGYPRRGIPPMTCGLSPFVPLGRSPSNDQQAAAAFGSRREWFHAHRASRCRHHPRHPAVN